MASKKLYLLPENLLQEFLSGKNALKNEESKIQNTIFDSDIKQKKIAELKNDLISNLQNAKLDAQTLNEYKNNLSKLLDLQKSQPEKSEINPSEPSRLLWTPSTQSKKQDKKKVQDKPDGGGGGDEDDDDDDDDDGDGDEEDDDDEIDDSKTEDENLKADKKQIAKEEKSVAFLPLPGGKEAGAFGKTPRKIKKLPRTPKSEPRVPPNSMLDGEMLAFESDRTKNTAKKIDLWLHKHKGHGIERMGRNFSIHGKKVKGELHDIIVDLARYTRVNELKFDSPGPRAGEEDFLRALAKVDFPESLIQNRRRRTVYNNIVREMGLIDSSDLKRLQESFITDPYMTPTHKQQRQRLGDMFNGYTD